MVFVFIEKTTDRGAYASFRRRICSNAVISPEDAIDKRRDRGPVGEVEIYAATSVSIGEDLVWRLRRAREIEVQQAIPRLRGDGIDLIAGAGRKRYPPFPIVHRIGAELDQPLTRQYQVIIAQRFVVDPDAALKAVALRTN